jgi:hypothetical protein
MLNEALAVHFSDMTAPDRVEFGAQKDKASICIWRIHA